MTAGAHWVIRGPSGNQEYMNETLIYIFLPSKRFIYCLEKILRGLRGPLRALREGPWPPCPPLGTSLAATITMQLHYVFSFAGMMPYSLRRAEVTCHVAYLGWDLRTSSSPEFLDSRW